MNFRREITILYIGKIEGDEIRFTRKAEGFGGPGGGPPGGGEGRPRAKALLGKHGRRERVGRAPAADPEAAGLAAACARRSSSPPTA